MFPGSFAFQSLHFSCANTGGIRLTSICESCADRCHRTFRGWLDLCDTRAPEAGSRLTCLTCPASEQRVSRPIKHNRYNNQIADQIEPARQEVLLVPDPTRK